MRLRPMHKAAVTADVDGITTTLLSRREADGAELAAQLSISNGARLYGASRLYTAGCLFATSSCIAQLP